LKIGDKFQDVIESAIRLHDKLLVVLSEHSVNSLWVEREVQAAFEKEQRHGSTVLFPVRLDDAVMDCPRAWAADIRRTRHIGDFRKWKNHDSFQKSVDRLLRDLKSQDPKPSVSFLRGAGAPDDFSTYLRSVAAAPTDAANATEYDSCFISYSSKDQDFADRLYADLLDKGVRCWFAPHDIQGGRKIHEQIDEAIRVHDKLLLILSEHSMRSEWVMTEIAKARKREGRDKQRVLFPIRLVPFETLRGWENFDPDPGVDTAREIRTYFIPDFSNWTNRHAYKEAFDHLLRDLKSQDSKPK